MSTRSELVTGLRSLASWLEAHPDVPLRPSVTIRHTVIAADDETGLAELAEISEAADSEIAGSFMQPDVEVHFGPVIYQAGYIRQRRMAAYQQHMESYNPPEVDGD